MSDEAAIARLHADSSQRAYRGILPDTYLNNDVAADRVALWHRRFHNPDEQVVTLTFVAELNRELVGFVHSVVDDDEEWGTYLIDLHVRHGAQRLGIGKKLMANTAAWLTDSATKPSLFLWVLEENAPARRFYETLGGKASGHKISHEGGGAAPLIRIWWPNLERLAL